MNRLDFQAIADVRIAEARRLVEAPPMPDGAYYLAGYAVECALKACIARLTNQGDFPDKQFAQECFTHSVERLVKLAGLKDERDADANANPDLEANWSVVKDWTEESRYGRNTEAKAKALIEAVVNAANGVLPWIKARW
ncbi:MAG: DNA-binding protein [Gemmataceae bacterium]